MQGFNADWSGLLNSTSQQAGMMGRLGKQFGDQMRAKREEKQREAKQQEMQEKMDAVNQGAADVFATGDEAKIAEYSLMNPSVSENIERLVANRNETTKQGQLQGMRDIILDPSNTEQILSKQAKLIEEHGGDPSNTLGQIEKYRANPKEYVQFVKDSYAMREPESSIAFHKARGEGGGKGLTSDMENFKYYQKLKNENPQAANEFGRQRGYVSKAGEELPVFQQKNLDSAQTSANKFTNEANSYTQLASDFRANPGELGGGIFGNWKSGFKKATGSEDAVSSLRTQWINAKNSEVIKNLPPGAASETDVSTIMKGFPSDDANPEQVANFLDSLAKVRKAQAQYNEFKAEYISDTAGTRNMGKAWKNKVNWPDAPKLNFQKKGFKYMGGDPNDKSSWRKSQ